MLYSPRSNPVMSRLKGFEVYLSVLRVLVAFALHLILLHRGIQLLLLFYQTQLLTQFLLLLWILMAL